jgi:hypothetical protein
MIVIDRIESGRAILECNGQLIEVDTELLPKGSQEGTVLALVICNNADVILHTENEKRLERLGAQDSGEMEIDI